MSTSDASGKRPFFIIGMRHSGSDALYALLCAHPEIALTNEARVLDALCFCYEYCSIPAGEVSIDRGFQGEVKKEFIPALSGVFERNLGTMLEEFYRTSFDKPFSRFGDTLNDPGWAIASKRIFPGVQFVVPARDPRDVICAARKTCVQSGAAFEPWASGPIRSQAEGWCKTYDFILSSESDVHVVPYQGLVSDPAGTLSAALGHLDLAADAATDEAVRAATGQTTDGISWQQDMTPDDAAVVAEVCGPMMSRLGLD